MKLTCCVIIVQTEWIFMTSFALIMDTPQRYGNYILNANLKEDYYGVIL